MNETNSAPLETKSGLPWPTIVLTGVFAALGYFVVNLVQRRRFYKDLVCLIPRIRTLESFIFYTESLPAGYDAPIH
jgi:hypothetical protein